MTLANTKKIQLLLLEDTIEELRKADATDTKDDLVTIDQLVNDIIIFIEKIKAGEELSVQEKFSCMRIFDIQISKFKERFVAGLVVPILSDLVKKYGEELDK